MFNWPIETVQLRRYLKTVRISIQRLYIAAYNPIETELGQEAFGIRGFKPFRGHRKASASDTSMAACACADAECRICESFQCWNGFLALSNIIDHEIQVYLGFVFA